MLVYAGAVMVLFLFIIMLLDTKGVDRPRIAGLPLVKFDFNPLHLRDQDSESVATLRDLMSDPSRTLNTIDVLMPGSTEAAAMAKTLAALPEVLRYVADPLQAAEFFSGMVLGQRQTQALYRRHFAGQVIGQRNGQPLHALCLLVDWRTLPQGMRATPQAYLSSASLLSSYPCD